MIQALNSKQTVYDLEDRTFNFTKRTGDFVRRLPKTVTNIEYGRQLVRSAGSVGANYIEANEALSRKDFILRVRIAKKEAKESHYWLRLVLPNAEDVEEQQELIQEARELTKILASIIEKSTSAV